MTNGEVALMSITGFRHELFQKQLASLRVELDERCEHAMLALVEVSPREQVTV